MSDRRVEIEKVVEVVISQREGVYLLVDWLVDFEFQTFTPLKL